MERGSDITIRRIRLAKGELLLYLHTDQAPTEAQWDEGLELMRQCESALGGDLSRMSIIAVTDGGAPTGPMRAGFISWLDGRQLNVSVVSDGTMVRGVVTAISWFNPMIKPFSPARWNEALTHGHATEAEGAIILADLERMDGEIRRRSRTLAAIRVHAQRATAASA